MPAPTDTPSTDGAPDPEEVRIEPTFHKRTPDRWTIEVIGLAGIRMFSVEATGPDDEVAIAWANEMADLVFRPVVPEDRPAPCPHCNDDGVVHTYDGIVLGPCDCAAGVPALDDDTRREVERIVEHLRHDVDVIDQGAYEDMAQVSRSIDRAAELLAAAYLGGTDGR